MTECCAGGYYHYTSSYGGLMVSVNERAISVWYPKSVTAKSVSVTLPWDEALVPGLLTLPLVGLSALGATRIVSAWQHREE